MTITIYDKYKIKHTCKYSYNDFDYNDFQTDTITEEFEMDGWEFLEKVVIKEMQERDFHAITFKDGMVYVERFDPNTGHTVDHMFELKEIEK